MKTSSFRHGFTIVELLIVIVVIAILASVSFATYNGVTERARATIIGDYFVKTEKAFQLLAIEKGITTWWTDNALVVGASNPSIPLLITNTDLRNYLQPPPTIGNITATRWFYDNDADSLSECGTGTTGVTILISSFSETRVARLLDESFDDGNLSCGKIRLAGSYLMYVISRTQEV